jgi:protein-disulfide isomerase/uncharacterized membrane protein
MKTPEPAPRAPITFPFSVVFAATGLIASLALVLKHFGAVDLPGCGVGAGCEAASASVWGSIMGVPVSIIGVGHFIAMLTITLVSKGRVGWPIIRGMQVAVAGSLIYVGIALGANLICAYCLVIHAANVLLLTTLSASSLPTMHGFLRHAFVGGAAAMASYALLIPTEMRVQAQARRKAEVQLAESTAAIVKQSKPDTKTPAKAEPEATKAPAATPQPKTDEAPAAKPAEPAAARTKVLDGRYRFGPEAASVRIVIFTDYQCPDCYLIEQELKTLMQNTPGISVGVRYFPLSSKCNPAMGTQDLHPNACWAARAAETAGMLRGVDGFWQMHHWLFDKRGAFTDAELVKGLTELGYDPAAFQQVMTGSVTQARIAEDVEFGQSLGLYFTPMIFINGVELRGWRAPQALTRAVQATLAANPPAATNTADVPADARVKYFQDWREQPRTTFPEGVMRHTLGPAEAKVHAVLIGDYSDKVTGDADGILRLFTNGPKPNIRYSFVQYPANSECNPTTQLKLNASACLAAKAAEAADALAGPQAFWAVHGHLMSHQAKIDAETIREAAVAAGISADDLLDAMQQPFVTDAIANDARIAMTLGIKSLPMVFIDGRFVPRWKLNNENLLAAMIFDADGTTPPPK